MTLQQIVAVIVAVGGLALGMISTYLAVSQYYDKRRTEDKLRQREELTRLKNERQAELDTYATAQQKSYAAERDFQHLMNQYRELSANINTLMNFQREERHELEIELKEVKAILNALLAHLSNGDHLGNRYQRKPE